MAGGVTEEVEEELVSRTTFPMGLNLEPTATTPKTVSFGN